MKTKKRFTWIFLSLFMFVLPLSAIAKDVSPIVSTEWLSKYLSNPKVVVLDIRKAEEYRAGHIPNAVNVFYGSWAIGKDGLRNQLPATDDLFDIIGSAGIDTDSIVVVVDKVDTMTDRVGISRVAWTLRYAGLENVTMLDGGYNKWVSDKKTVSTEPFKAKAKTYKGKVNDNFFVNKDYVKSRLGKAIIVDTREPDFYLGKKKLDFVAKAGHIAGAISMPTSVMYNKDGTLKSKNELELMASSAIGKDITKEVIIYCDTGKFATIWAFLLSDLFGYKNVKVYDGSMEEWTKDTGAPME